MSWDISSFWIQSLDVLVNSYGDRGTHSEEPPIHAMSDHQLFSSWMYPCLIKEGVPLFVKWTVNSGSIVKSALFERYSRSLKTSESRAASNCWPTGYLWWGILRSLNFKSLRFGWNNALNISVVDSPRCQFVPEVKRTSKASNQNYDLVTLAWVRLGLGEQTLISG